MDRRALIVASLGLALLAGLGRPGRAETVMVPTRARPLRVVLPAAGSRPAPVVVMSHGYLGSSRDHASIATRLAASGTAVALFDAPSNTDLDPHHWRDGLVQGLDALELATGPGGALAGRVDFARLGLMGHSYGGGTVLSAAAIDRRVKAVVALAPAVVSWHRDRLVRDAAGVRVPTLILSGSLDPLAPAATFAAPLTRAIPGAQHVALRGGTHENFSDKATPPLLTLMGPLRLGLSNRTQQDASASHYEPWFATHLAASP